MSDFYFEGGSSTPKQEYEPQEFNGEVVVDGYDSGVNNSSYIDRTGNIRSLRNEHNKPTKPLGCCLAVVVGMFLIPILFIIGVWIIISYLL